MAIPLAPLRDNAILCDYPVFMVGLLLISKELTFWFICLPEAIINADLLYLLPLIKHIIAFSTTFEQLLPWIRSDGIARGSIKDETSKRRRLSITG